MADLSTVEKALVDTAAAALFPNLPDYQDADYQMSAAGVVVTLYRGFPTQAVLDADLAAGRAHVSVFVQPNMTRLMTPYQDYWRVSAPAVPTLTVATEGLTVTFGGTATPGHVAGVKIGNQTAVYVVQAGDTPVTVAQQLAAGIAPLVPGVTSSGATLYAPTDVGLVGRVMLMTPAMLETRWQEQGFQVSVWCAGPLQRDAVASVLDSAFAATRWLPFPDGSAGHVLYQRTVVFDTTGRDDLWRRDLLYKVQYPSTLVQQLPSVLFGITDYPNQNLSVVA